jgi:hypothetical protein
MLLALLLAATVRGPGDVESLTASADAVVHARVARQASAWVPSGGQIFTTVVLRTIETWKGEPASEWTVLVPGGDVGEVSQTVQGVATFRDGEEVVVFLHRRARSVYGVERLALGKFAVGAPPGLAKRALRDRRGLACAGCTDGETDDFSLDELRSRVVGSSRR